MGYRVSKEVIMRKIELANVVLSTLLAVVIGCGQGEKSPQMTAKTETPDAKAATTPEDNPTTRAGRGEPTLDQPDRLPAWIYVDGEEGQFIERNGVPQVQWVIRTPVSRNPTFHVEVYEPLLGNPKDFLCALQTDESFDGSSVIYAIRAKEGKFEVGKEYSLLKPGDDWIILDKTTDEEISQIPLLSPGTYAIAATVRNSETQKEGLAVTFFTVGGEVTGSEPVEPAPAPVSASPTEGGGS